MRKISFLLFAVLFFMLDSCKKGTTLEPDSRQKRPAPLPQSATSIQNAIPNAIIGINQERILVTFPENVTIADVKLNWETDCYFLSASIELRVNTQNGQLSLIAFSDGEGRTVNDVTILSQNELVTPYLTSLKFSYNASLRALKATAFINGCHVSGAHAYCYGYWSPSKAGGLGSLPLEGFVKDGYYIVSKISGRALTKVADAVQIEQTESAPDNAEPSTNADITIAHFGQVNNPANFAPGTYANYKLQWGRFAPYTLYNRFWEVNNSSLSGNNPVITAISSYLSNQQYVFLPTGDSDESVYIVSLATGKYLQIAGNAQVNIQSGAKLETTSFTGAINQKFFIWKRSGF